MVEESRGRNLTPPTLSWGQADFRYEVGEICKMVIGWCLSRYYRERHWFNTAWVFLPPLFYLFSPPLSFLSPDSSPVKQWREGSGRERRQNNFSQSLIEKTKNLIYINQSLRRTAGAVHHISTLTNGLKVLKMAKYKFPSALNPLSFNVPLVYYVELLFCE